MQVETKNASLDTLAVTIQALCVSGKQMTLAVFRQLPEAELCLPCGGRDERLSWWGLVRYKIGEAGDLWVVAEKDGILCRCSASNSDAKSLAAGVEELAKMIRTRRGLYFRGRNFNHIDDVVGEHAVQAEKLDRALFRQETIDAARDLPQLFIAV